MVAALLLLYFLYSIAQVLLLFFIGVLFAIYLCAITDALQERLAVPRTAGLLIAVISTHEEARRDSPRRWRDS
jgi:predicted PurR-regulated permease PerM